jgi:hypothetical protein
MAQSVAMFYLTTEGCKTDGLVASEITPSQSPDRQRSWRWNGPNSYERRGEIMPECLFCRREFENFTDEHVFPAAIGGKLMLRNARVQTATTASRKSSNSTLPAGSCIFAAFFLSRIEEGRFP